MGDFSYFEDFVIFFNSLIGKLTLFEFEVFIDPHLPYELLYVGDEYHRPFIFVEGFGDHG